MEPHAHSGQSAFGQHSRFPWDCVWPDGDWEWALSVPQAEQADANHMRMTVHECVGEQEAIDTANALRKVEKAYRA